MIIYESKFIDKFDELGKSSYIILLIFLIIIGLAIINFINFMDGIDGLVAGSMIIIFLMCAILYLILT